ncbi:unnamed protein product, partial [Penicillium manginii]
GDGVFHSGHLLAGSILTHVESHTRHESYKSHSRPTFQTGLFVRSTSLIRYTTMGAIRKTSRTRKMPDFRRRLQRALSLSSSESEHSRSPSRSLSGDTTEEEPSTPSNKNVPAVPQQGDPRSTHDRGVLPRPHYGGNVSQPRDSNVLTLTCLAELVRVTPYHLRRDLTDFLHRLEAVEAKAEERIKSDTTHTPDGPEQKTVLTRRSQR